MVSASVRSSETRLIAYISFALFITRYTRDEPPLPIRSSRAYAFLLTTRLRVFTSVTGAGTASSSPMAPIGSGIVGLRLRTETAGARGGGVGSDSLGDVDVGRAGSWDCNGGRLPTAERKVSDSCRRCP